MTAVAGNATAASRAGFLRDRSLWIAVVDVVAILIALSLPWSTSLVAIFAAVLLVAMVPFLDLRAFLQSLKRPICVVPIALFVLAAVGTLWSDAAWGARLYAVGPDRETADAAGAVLSFRTLRRAASWVLVGLSGVLRAADGDVVARRVRPRPRR